MFKKIQSLFLPKDKPVLVPKQWKTGMWVIFQTEPYILHKVGDPCEIHGVDKHTGDTIIIQQTSLDFLRQATYDEIPAIRRNISREQAKELGYAS
jgi:hypothetical protein